MRIAFIGLGNMGSGMAANQANAGRDVAAFDLSAEALQRAQQAGCTPRGSASEAVADAEVVITMLPAGPHVRKVYEEQVFGKAAPGSLLIDCSTIDPETAREVAGRHGTGQAAKICNNMLLGISMIGTCEAFALAERLGLEADRFFEIASKSSGQCWSLTSYCPVPGPVPVAPSNRGYTGGVATPMMLKEPKLA